MDVIDFVDTIDDHPHLYGLGMNEKGDDIHLFIECVQANNLVTELSTDAVEACEWKDLQSILMGEREPHVLDTITRVCGYFSRVSNFNSSKVAERADRMNGNYTL